MADEISKDLTKRIEELEGSVYALGQAVPIIATYFHRLNLLPQETFPLIFDTIEEVRSTQLDRSESFLHGFRHTISEIRSLIFEGLPPLH